MVFDELVGTSYSPRPAAARQGLDSYMYMYHMYIHTLVVEAPTYIQFCNVKLKLYDRIRHFGSSPVSLTDSIPLPPSLLRRGESVKIYS